MGTPWSKGRTLIDLVVDRYVNLELFYQKQAPAANGCINWTGVTTNIGYGFIGFRKTDPVTLTPLPGQAGMMTVHRLAWMIDHGQLPTQRNVNHTCNNKLCVNPAHLVEGTQQEKLNQMVAAGIKGGRPLGKPIGPYNHQQENRKYKYSPEDIQWVRTSTSAEIAARYNVTVVRAASKRHQFRQGYRWLPLPEGIENEQ